MRLGVHRLREERTGPRTQFLGGALLGDGTAAHHKNAVRSPDGGHAVRYHKNGDVAVESFYRGLNGPLRLRVERARRLIKHEEFGLPRQDTRERHALALSAGEKYAAVPDVRVVPLRKSLDKVVHVGEFGGFDNALTGDGRVVERNIGLERIIEQYGVLRHVADAGPPCGDRNFTDRKVVGEDGTALRLHEAQEQVRDGGFPCARGPYNRGQAALGEGKAHIREHLSALRVRERDLLECEPLPYRERLRSPLRLHVLLRLVDVGKRPFDVRSERYHRVQLLLPRLYLREYLVHRVHDDAERRVRKISRAIHNDEDDGDENDTRELYDGPEVTAQNDRPQIEIAHTLEEHVGPLDDGTFERHRFQRLHADDVLADEMGKPSRGALRLEADGTRAIKDGLEDEGYRRTDDKAQCGEPP